MRVAVTGSIANDYLMDFPGRFRDQLVDGRLEHLSLSFLVDDLRIHRGGVGANIAFGLGRLGLAPLLVGAAGEDFAPYAEWLEGHGVDTRHVRRSGLRHTARFLCTTDADQNQIASFYAGAMVEARDIDLGAILAGPDAVDLVVISPDDPEAMLRHAEACRTRGLTFAADPSQQLARMQPADIRALVTGARWLFTNAYERDLLHHKTGWGRAEVLDRVGAWVVTLGADGAEIASAHGGTVHVHAVPGIEAVDPTGVGDAFRAGFIAALAHDLDPVGAAQVGSALASFALGTVGTQEYTFTARRFLDRLEGAYGPEAAERVVGLLGRRIGEAGGEAR